MSWKETDKAAALYLIVELAAKMEPEEVFQTLVYISSVISDRFDLAEAEAPREYPQLEEFIRQCLKTCAA